MVNDECNLITKTNQLVQSEQNFGLQTESSNPLEGNAVRISTCRSGEPQHIEAMKREGFRNSDKCLTDNEYSNINESANTSKFNESVGCAECAVRYFKEGYNCAQSVIGPFHKNINMDFEDAMKLASSFGGGMGRLREVCGAMTASFMVIGIISGYTSPGDDIAKTEHYRLVQDFASKFKSKFGTIICRELLGLPEGADEHVPEARTKSYYDKRPCDKFIEFAAGVLEDYFSSLEHDLDKNCRIQY